ncbi:MAG: 16S rRNA (guanine(527)-N(7))-methyltransferase RsmG [Phycisphaerales bacterium]|nr:16S rRNA (guanine(527)-N(7))-methyltransferase RsmG [Phycisphaerales bacterium]
MPDSASNPSAASRFRLPDAAPLTPPRAFLDDAEGFGLELEPVELELLGAYLGFLLASNEQVNLTAVTDPDTAWRRHILDALTLFPLLAEVPDGGCIADVGSGGGLPGIPLAIVRPFLRVFLIESVGKKAEFLRQVCAKLELRNVRVVADRAERLAHRRTMPGPQGETPGRECFDAVCARAVGRLASLLEVTVPLARIGAPVLLIKGEKASEELEEAAPVLHALKAVHAGTVETPTGRVVVITKSSATPKVYPARRS